MKGRKKVMEDTLITDLNIGPLIFGILIGLGGNLLKIIFKSINNPNYLKKDIKKVFRSKF